VPGPEPSSSDRQALEKSSKNRVSDFMQRHCKKLLLTMMERHFGHVFNMPVDLEKYPNYLSVVDKPMDFGMIRKKIDSNACTRLDDFVSDVNLVLDNARKFNAPNSLVHHMANALQVCAASCQHLSTASSVATSDSSALVRSALVPQALLLHSSGHQL
jgi:hypothetical protein